MAELATTTIDYAEQVLADVRREIAVDDDILSETKARRNLVKRYARSFHGALKTFDSGSVAQILATNRLRGKVVVALDDNRRGALSESHTIPNGLHRRLLFTLGGMSQNLVQR